MKKRILKLFFLFIIFLFVFVTFRRPAGKKYDIKVFKELKISVLIEDFNNNLNKNYWNIIDKGDNYNNELEYYRPENVNVKNGFLEIEAKKEDFNNHQYTSGSINTKDKFEFLYGKIIFKAKPAVGKGLISAIWLLPADDSALPEIDLIEVLGTQNNHTWTGMHYFDSNLIQQSKFITYPCNDGFSVYEMDWKKEEIKVYRDNKLIFETTNNVPDKKMYLIINLSVGGDWPGDPDDSSLPSSFFLDYVIIIPEEIGVK
ncbi:MAG: glycoside hydrolase family 16 protein [Bacilli bacterium]|nr:glycoside hydrolase family 16 protein [Bacilli bacterium]MDD4407273.1 glycoside hydrolase family 16 protein [Bacilli bacterium]